MYYVYVLVNTSLDKHYIGYTANLKRRLSEHLQRKTYWTRRLTCASLYYYEAYLTKELARGREKSLKVHGSAKRGVFKRIGLK